MKKVAGDSRRWFLFSESACVFQGNALAGALFEACEEGGNRNAALDTNAHVSEALVERLHELRQDLPPGCETARLIDAGAGLEEISEAAQEKGLTSLATMLFEAEQEQDRAS